MAETQKQIAGKTNTKDGFGTSMAGLKDTLSQAGGLVGRVGSMSSPKKG
jgi:hypothetical protein